MGDAAVRTAQQLIAQSAPPQTPTAPAAPAYNPEDYITGAQLATAQQQAYAQYVQPGVNQALDLAASGNLDRVKQKYADKFAKYGPEILATLSVVPKAQWTIDNLEKVVKLSLVDHVDEMARERAEHLLSEMTPTMRSGGAGSGSVPTPQPDFSLKSEKLPEAWRKRAESLGLTEQALTEFCASNGMSREDFFKQFEKGLVSDAVTEISIRRA